MSRFVTQQRGIFHFRRRVPARVAERIGCRELYRSLYTSNLKLAVRRARKLVIATDELFAMSIDRKFSDDQIRAAVRLSFEKLNKGHAEAIQKTDVSGLPELLEKFAHHQLRWDDEHAQQDWHMSGPTMDDLEASWNLNVAGFDGYSATYSDKSRFVEILTDEFRKIIKIRHDFYYSSDRNEFEKSQIVNHPLVSPETSVTSDSSLGEDGSRLFSVEFAKYIAEKTTATSKSGKKSSYRKPKSGRPHPSARLLAQLIGDFPVEKYTRKMAKEFKQQLSLVPQAFGKGNCEDVWEAIEAVNEETLLMKGKTIKKHFSALSGFWVDQIDSNLASSNIFLGHIFDLTDSIPRQPWRTEDLIRFFSDAIWTDLDDDSTSLWLPVIGLFTGMRLDEIANLSASNGVVQSPEGILYFKVAPHSGWSGKTPAAHRRIPVHNALLQLGLERMLAVKSNVSERFLFSDLRETDYSEGRSSSYSRRFSYDLRRLNYPISVTFHSFRHTFRTKIASSKHLDRHLDAVTGHASPPKTKNPDEFEGQRSQGKKYEHPDLFPLSLLHDVVESFTVDEAVMKCLKSRLIR